MAVTLLCPNGHSRAEFSVRYGRRRALMCAECLREISVRNSRRRRDLLNEIKDQPCADCGGEFPVVCMDFDHRDPSQKLFTIGANKTVALERLLAEVAKCDVVCANCHRIREEARGYRRGGRGRHD